ncbi:hypothetical protein ACLKMH_22670 [Psychromonas sp. KJ10-10]|uniref:hypothetical protein n=1 Tax=Psychromonas sp. KJ10-10 TaxID=3391823 RepID=UPI0039B63542
MIDAICTLYAQDDENKAGNKVFSIFEFKALPESEINRLRYSLICPDCKQVAYFRKASRDGKQACFGSRYHAPDCKEFNPSVRRVEEEKEIAEVEKILLEADSLKIDFSRSALKKRTEKNTSKIKTETIQRQAPADFKEQNETEPGALKDSKSDKLNINKQGLGKLLTSLLRGSSLANSDLWVYTSEKHKWRAKNLFVNVNQAQPTENGAPRMYWGTISHADNSLHWLNPAEERSVAIPISKYRESLLERFDIQETRDIEGAGFILFAKCVESKDKKRKFLQLWGNDVNYFFSLKPKNSPPSLEEIALLNLLTAFFHSHKKGASKRLFSN